MSRGIDLLPSRLTASELGQVQASLAKRDWTGSAASSTYAFGYNAELDVIQVTTTSYRLRPMPRLLSVKNWLVASRAQRSASKCRTTLAAGAVLARSIRARTTAVLLSTTILRAVPLASPFVRAGPRRTG